MANETTFCAGCMREIPADASICPYCGFDYAAYQPESFQLPPYTVIGGHYLIGKMLGHGGFGIVYIGKHLALGNTVAVKELFPSNLMTRIVSGDRSSYTVSYLQDRPVVDEIEQKFVREARALAALQTENPELDGIVRVYDLVEENRTVYMVMEYLDGVSLREALKKAGRIPYADLLHRLEPVFRALMVLHKRGIVHRDVSPDNIQILSGGQVKLMDFGDIKIRSGSPNSPAVKSSVVQVKRGYSPLEQYQNEGNIGPWTDIYALCATIYTCITGKKPEEPIERIRTRTAPPSELGVDIPPAAEAALMKGLSIRPEDRQQSMEELLAGLRSTGGSGQRTPTPPTPPTPPTSPNQPGKVKPAVIIAAIMIAAAVAALAFGLSSMKSGRPETPATAAVSETKATENHISVTVDTAAQSESVKQSEAESAKQSEAESAKQSEAESAKQSEEESAKQSEEESAKQSEAESSKQSEAAAAERSKEESARESEAESTRQSEAESAAQSEAESTAASEAESTSASEAESTAASEAESTSASEAESTAASEAESTSVSEAESTAASEAESTSVSEAESTAASEAESTSASEAESTSASEAESAKQSEAESAKQSEAESAKQSEAQVSIKATLQDLDPFDGIDVKFSWMSPNERAKIVNKVQNPWLQTLTYTLDKESGISVGDVVTVTVQTTEEEAEKHGYRLTSLTKQFECTDTGYWLTGYEQLSAEQVKELEDTAFRQVKEYLESKDIDEDPAMAFTVFAYQKEVDESTGDDINDLIFYYDHGDERYGIVFKNVFITRYGNVGYDGDQPYYYDEVGLGERGIEAAPSSLIAGLEAERSTDIYNIVQGVWDADAGTYTSSEIGELLTCYEQLSAWQIKVFEDEGFQLVKEYLEGYGIGEDPTLIFTMLVSQKEVDASSGDDVNDLIFYYNRGENYYGIVFRNVFVSFDDSLTYEGPLYYDEVGLGDRSIQTDPLKLVAGLEEKRSKDVYYIVNGVPGEEEGTFNSDENY